MTIAERDAEIARLRNTARITCERLNGAAEALMFDAQTDRPDVPTCK